MKGVCKKLINSITLKLNEPEHAINVQEIELLSEKLQIREKEIFDVETKIESLPDELQKDLESRKEYRDQIIELKMQMKKIEKVKTSNNEAPNI